MTITSKEVAEMLGKRHDNLLRAIRKYITQLGDEAPKYFSEDPDKGGRLYHITKAGCDLMAGRIIGAQSEAFKTSQIEYYCVKIPALMYYAGQRVEELGMQVDLASNAKKSAQNEAMVKVSGTVQEKKARVEQLTEDKALVEAIYRRAYNSLKVKLEMAEKIYSGLKKSLSKRIAEVDLDRFSKDKYTREPEDPMED